MKSIFVLVALLMAFAAGPAAAADSVTIRLVEASNGGDGSSSGLGDVISILKKTLSFKSYTIKASGSVPLPAEGNTVSLGGYSVACRGGQSQLEIVIRSGRDVLLNTTASLKTGTPLVLGGFPGNGSKLVFIFVAK